MEKQKTAVEWLKHQLSSFLKEDDEVFNLIQQSIEFEKQQRESEFERGYLKCASDLNLIMQNGIKYSELANKIKSEFNANI